jgi:RNA polymerase sigma-70 factor (ECF subfamily)
MTSIAITTAAAGVPISLASTMDLVARARGGDVSARDLLFERALPPLRRWARGRLPCWARELSDTQDLVQDTVLRALSRLDSFEVRHQGALHAYLRRAVINRIRDEIRRVKRRPLRNELCEQHPVAAPSPLQHAIGREAVEKYRAALQRLRPLDRQAIVARLEWQLTYEEIAALLNKPTAEAARLTVTRAIARLIKAMDYEH